MYKLTAQLRNARLLDGRVCDLRIQQGVLTQMQPALPDDGSELIDVDGRAVTVALKDHHLHLNAAAVAAASLMCAPPDVASREQLAQRLSRALPDAQGWVRALGFHEAHVGEVQRQDLDRWRSDVPVRLQHASGRLWVFNSKAIQQLGDAVPWASSQDQARGHLLDQDAWLSRNLRARPGARPPDLTALSQQLASWGVVALTDTTPANDEHSLAALRSAHVEGRLRQRIAMMGQDSLNPLYADPPQQGVGIAALKIHLLESALPDFDALCQRLRQAHAHTRPVAFHCVSRAELVYALAALDTAGSIAGDRIEHAGVCPDETLQMMRDLGVWVVTQPVFVAQRGDRYRQQVAAEDQPWLYRLQSLLQAGIAVAGSSDAPYGDLNPWQGIAAAMQRRTAQGHIMGEHEALSFEQALALYQGDLMQPGKPCQLHCGQHVDLCVLDQDWQQLSAQPQQASACLVLESGRVIWRKTR